MTTLVEYDKNAKKHPTEQLELIAKSISRFGWQQPIKAGKGGVILAGHGRYKAYNQFKEIYPMKTPWVIDEDGKTISGEAETKKLTKKEEDAYRLADNQINAMSGVDMSLVKDELKLIADEELVRITGFDIKLLNDQEPEDDDVPGVPLEPRSKLGDIYDLGPHRVMCGDSTNGGDVTLLMNGKKADCWITDPPYNVNYTGGTGLKIENDSMEDGKFLQFLSDAFHNAVTFLKPGGSYYIWHADSEGLNFRQACKNVGLTVRQCLIWKKSQLVMGRQDYQWKHEPCLYGWKEGSSHLWNADRSQTTVLEFDKPAKNGEHPTMKPVELMAYQIGNNTKGEDIVLDTFLGSGSTLIASEKIGRVCYGLELDPKYVDVIVQRYVDYTGNTEIMKNGEKDEWAVKSKTN